MFVCVCCVQVENACSKKKNISVLNNEVYGTCAPIHPASHPSVKRSPFVWLCVCVEKWTLGLPVGWSIGYCWAVSGVRSAMWSVVLCLLLETWALPYVLRPHGWFAGFCIFYLHIQINLSVCERERERYLYCSTSRDFEITTILCRYLFRRAFDRKILCFVTSWTNGMEEFA